MSAINHTPNSCCAVAKHYTEVACTGVLVVGMIAGIALSIISLSAPQLLGKFAFPPGKAIFVLTGSGILLTGFTMFAIAIKCHSSHSTPQNQQTITAPATHDPQESSNIGNANTGAATHDPQESTDAGSEEEIETLILNPLDPPEGVLAYDRNGNTLTQEDIARRLKDLDIDENSFEIYEYESNMTQADVQTCLNLLVSTNEEFLTTSLATILPLLQSTTFSLADSILYHRIYLLEKFHPELRVDSLDVDAASSEDISTLTLSGLWSINGTSLAQQRNQSPKDAPLRYLFPFISSWQFTQALSSGAVTKLTDLVFPYTWPVTEMLMKQRMSEIPYLTIFQRGQYFSGTICRCLTDIQLKSLPWAKLVESKSPEFWTELFYVPYEGEDGDKKEVTRHMLSILPPATIALIKPKLTPQQIALIDDVNQLD